MKPDKKNNSIFQKNSAKQNKFGMIFAERERERELLTYSLLANYIIGGGHTLRHRKHFIQRALLNFCRPAFAVSRLFVYNLKPTTPMEK